MADDDLIQVSKGDFYAAVGPLDVHPRSDRDVTFWEMPDRRVIGRSTPGYMGGGEKTYFLLRSLQKAG